MKHEVPFELSTLEFDVLHTIDSVAKYISSLKNGSQSDCKTDNCKVAADTCSIAYTLQAGREAMEERLAIIADDVKTLDEKLTLYLDRQQNISKLYRGSTLQADDNSKLLMNVISDTRITSDLMKNNELDKIAQLWVTGINVDWNLLYVKKPRRISLPVYPFAKEVCWVRRLDDKCEEEGNVQTKVIHPLLHSNTSNIYELRYSTDYDGNENVLNDHVINGQKILPGVTYLEMVHAAVKSAMELTEMDTASISIRDVIWIQPFMVAGDSKTLHISLSPNETGEIEFIIYSLSDDEGTEKIIHCQGCAKVEEKSEISTIDLEALRSQCKRARLGGAWCYKLFEAMGIHYGPSHNAIENLCIGENQMIAELMLPSCVEKDFPRYMLHPSLLDAALQATIGLSLPVESISDSIVPENVDSKIQLPFSIDKVEVYKECNKQMYAVIQTDRGLMNDGNLKKINIDICDLQGNICVRLKRVTFRVYDAKQKQAGNKNQKMMFVPEWRERKLSLTDSTDKFSQCIAILCNPGVSTVKEVEKQLPNTKCIALQSNSSNISQQFEDYAVQLLKEVQSIFKYKNRGTILLQLVVCTNLEKQVFAGLFGLLKTAGSENPNLIGQLIEIDKNLKGKDICRVLKDNREDMLEQRVRYVNNKRFVGGLGRLTISEDNMQPVWKNSGVYVLTGGTGKIGLLVANEIAKKAKNVNLVLVGRTELQADKNQEIEKIKEYGARVCYKQVDITDATAANNLVQAVIQEFGTINGILHLSGVTRDNLIIKKNEKELREVLKPKAAGVLNLDNATSTLSLDFFILFSSLASVIGNTGQADYAAANSFMDNFAVYRNNMVRKNLRFGNTISLNWQLWEKGGMQIRSEIQDLAKDGAGLVPMETLTGMELLYACIASGNAQVIPLEGDEIKINNYLQNIVCAPIDTTMNMEVEESTAYENTKEVNLAEQLLPVLKSILSEEIKLRVDRIDERAPLEHYGIDSVMIMKLTSSLEKILGQMPKTMFFENETLLELSKYLSDVYPERVKSLLHTEEKPQVRKSMVKNNSIMQKQVNINGKKKSSIWENRRPQSYAASSVKEEHNPEALDIAIIGVAGQYPDSPDLEEYWKNLKNGKDCISKLPRDRWECNSSDEGKTKMDKEEADWGGFLKDIDCFDPMFFNISPREAEIIDPQERLFLQCVYKAIEDAGYTRQTLSPKEEDGLSNNVGVFVGVMYEEYQLYGADAQMGGGVIPLNGIEASIANRVSYYCGFHGPSVALDTMCSSSLVSIHLACQSIRNGDCEVSIAGGVNLSLHPNKYIMLERNRFMSSKPIESSNGQDTVSSTSTTQEGDETVDKQNIGDLDLLEDFTSDDDAMKILDGIDEETLIDMLRKEVMDTIVSTLELQGVKCNIEENGMWPSGVYVKEINSYRNKLSSETYSKAKYRYVSVFSAETIRDPENLKLDLTDHTLVSTIEYEKSIESIYQQGYRFFIELGVSPYRDESSESILKNEDVVYIKLLQDSEHLQGILQGLAKFVCLGAHVNWENFYKGYDCRKIELPNYPFSKSKYWVAPPSVLEDNEYDLALHSKDGLAGREISFPTKQKQFRFIFTYKNFPELADNTGVVHVGYFMEMLESTMKMAYGNIPYIIKNMVFISALMVLENEIKEVILLLEPNDNDDEIMFYFHSRNANQKNWSLHVKGALRCNAKTEYTSLSSIDELKAICGKNYVEEEDFYKVLKDNRGFNFGKSVRWNDKIWYNENEAIACFRNRRDSDGKREYALGLHPGIMDSCAQIYNFLSMLKTPEGKKYMVKSMEKVQIDSLDVNGLFYGYIKLSHNDGKNGEIQGSLKIIDEIGRTSISIGSIMLKEFDEEKLGMMKGLMSSTTFSKGGKDTQFLEKYIEADAEHKLELVTEYVKGILAMTVDAEPETIDVSEDLDNYGFDSMVGVSFINKLLELLGIEISYGELVQCKTLINVARTLLPVLPGGALFAKEDINVDYDTDMSLEHWIYHYKENRNAKLRIFCFPNGYRSADMYREWQDKLGTDIDVCAIQLPGLDVERMNEKVPTDVDDFIETLETVLSKSLFDIPCVAFGHSWGALFAYRLASRLSKNPNVKFLKLFVSAFTSPTLPNSSITKILAVLKTQGYNRIPSYDEVKAEKSLRDSVVQAFKTVWDYDEELTKMSLQLLLGALKLVDSYKYDENERFDLPIVGFHGIDDYIVELDEMNEWENVTSGLFKLYTMAGDHQYVVKDQSEDRLIRLVKDELVNYMTDK